MKERRPIRILGVRLDLGQRRRGVDMGPSAIRAAGLERRLEQLGYVVEDGGDVAVGLPETRPEGDHRARYLEEIARVCARTARRVEHQLDAGATPLTLGGDHSIAVGTLAGVARHAAKRGEKVGLLWLDAHADINTPETSPSGNVHGMPLAYCFGLAGGPLAKVAADPPLTPPESTVLFGVRDLDPGERLHVRQLGLRVITMREIDEMGVRAAMGQALAWASEGTDGFHVSLDLDWLDPTEAPGVGSPCRGGVTYREAHLAMELIADTGLLRSLDVVEVNPILDVANGTAELAVELTLSAFGKRIL